MFVNNLDPVAFEFLSLQIRWYSLAYIFGFIIGWFYTPICKKLKSFQYFQEALITSLIGTYKALWKR